MNERARAGLHAAVLTQALVNQDLQYDPALVRAITYALNSLSAELNWNMISDGSPCTQLVNDLRAALQRMTESLPF